ncbi:MAG: Lar family restriction alleviation protein [Clostridia bacterium]
MTDLERRALLGDREAQEECTEKGIVLPCPFCGSKKIIRSNWGMWRCWCSDCKSAAGDALSARDALKNWNTRAAPPVGRCGTCEHNFTVVDDFGNPYILCGWHGMNMEKDDYCSYYEPKEANHGQE